MRTLPDTKSALAAFSLLALTASPAVLAEAPSPELAQLLQQLQERVERLETRNAELERRLADVPRQPARDEQLAARVEDVESELTALRAKPSATERLEGVTAGASLVMAGQRASGGDAGDSQLTARADIEVEIDAGSIGDAQGRLFAHFRAGEGDGIAPPSFATPNATGGFGTSRPALMQAWYQLDIPVGGRTGNLGQVEVTLGKIDPFGFFDGNNVADDESEGFLNQAFVHNPLLDAGGDIGVGSDGASPGVRLAYVSDINGANHVTASLGLFGSDRGGDYTDTFGNPVTIAQVEYAGKVWGGKAGAYRLYAWNNARAFALDGATEESHRGWGLSLDQQVTADGTLFARYGHSTKGEMAFDRAFTLGGQLAGTGWGRADDRLGLAFGWLKSSGEYRDANPGFSGTEKNAELFYVWQANENLHLSPSVQWIGRPGADPATDNVTILGVRAKVAY